MQLLLPVNLLLFYAFDLSDVISAESIRATAHSKLINATAFVAPAPAPAPPFPYGVLQNANASGSSQQSSAHNVSIIPSYLLLVYGCMVM